MADEFTSQIQSMNPIQTLNITFIFWLIIGLFVFLGILFFFFYKLERKKFVHKVIIFEDTNNGIKWNEYEAKLLDTIESPLLVLWEGGLFKVLNKKKRFAIPNLSYKNKLMRGMFSNIYMFYKDADKNFSPVVYNKTQNTIEGIDSDLKLWLADKIEENVILTSKSNFWDKYGGIITVLILVLFAYLIIDTTMSHWDKVANQIIASQNAYTQALRNNTETIVYLAKANANSGVVP